MVDLLEMLFLAVHKNESLRSILKLHLWTRYWKEKLQQLLKKLSVSGSK